tara:strand:+ start:1664 stop:2800 length:1137 start_codon:yes stop_codon:yes gene_type:complete
MKILVTNSGHKNTLAAVRSLGRNSHFVGVSGMKSLDFASYSKYVNQVFFHENPLSSPEKVKLEFKKFLTKNSYDVILPIGIDMVAFFSKNLNFFGQYCKIPISNYSIFREIHDKDSLLKIADNLGIPIPKTYTPRDFTDYIKIIPSFGYPHVIKARRGSSNSGVFVIENLEDAKRKYNEVVNTKSEDRTVFDYTKPLVQEYIGGEIHDVCTISDNGKIKQALTQKRLKTLPIRGGSGIVNMTTLNKDLIYPSVKLLSKLGWSGVSQIEYKLDSNGVPRLMEVNPKFWGTLDLSIKAGINFPNLAVKLANGDSIPSKFKYKPDMRYRWILPYELIHFVKSRKGFLDFFKPDRNAKTNICFYDPLPDIVHLFKMIQRFVS